VRTDAAAAARGQIKLLLEEYRALRSEIDQRIGTRATLRGFLMLSPDLDFTIGILITAVALPLLLAAVGGPTGLL
jgi:hypothetical protein